MRELEHIQGGEAAICVIKFMRFTVAIANIHLRADASATDWDAVIDWVQDRLIDSGNTVQAIVAGGWNCLPTETAALRACFALRADLATPGVSTRLDGNREIDYFLTRCLRSTQVVAHNRQLGDHLMVTMNRGDRSRHGSPTSRSVVNPFQQVRCTGGRAWGRCRKAA
ncbi:unnamed protein product [Prorocentrum cordatum]|uniref:Uncharacterized protein n=1 Tax=Prorocentrum cordatum TaxID=2364126 RepID=A0ABN9XCZ9_9DINO|nr:unnamed protein product [Polarella glacialis]